MQSRTKAHFSHIFLPWVQIGSEQNRSNLPMGVAFNFNMMVYAYSLPSQTFCSCFWSLVCFLFLNLIRIFNRSWFRHGKLYTIMRSHISPSCAAEEASHKAAPQQGSNYGDQWCTDNVKPVQNLEPRASLFSTLFWQSPCSHLLEKKNAATVIDKEACLQMKKAGNLPPGETQTPFGCPEEKKTDNRKV